MMLNSVILIGLSGSGKTTCGEKLCATLGWEFIDTDTLIEQENGFTIADLFSEFGEEHFRALETQLLLRIADNRPTAEEQSADDPQLSMRQTIQTGRVIATGGGMPIAPGNLDLLRKLGTTVYLETAIPVLVHRLMSDLNRPLLVNQTAVNRQEQIFIRLTQLFAERESIYRLAQFKLTTDKLNPAGVVQELLAVINGGKIYPQAARIDTALA